MVKRGGNDDLKIIPKPPSDPSILLRTVGVAGLAARYPGAGMYAYPVK